VTRARVTDSPEGDELARRPDLPTFRHATDEGAPCSGSGSAALTIQPAFDGLRGVAVLGVLAAHLGEFLVPGLTPWPLRGGFLGVDLFFVLSGFLITGLLLKELERSRRIRVKRFYLRRVGRAGGNGPDLDRQLRAARAALHAPARAAGRAEPRARQAGSCRGVGKHNLEYPPKLE
jgi:hypothetical protein